MHHCSKYFCRMLLIEYYIDLSIPNTNYPIKTLKAKWVTLLINNLAASKQGINFEILCFAANCRKPVLPYNFGRRVKPTSVGFKNFIALLPFL